MNRIASIILLVLVLPLTGWTATSFYLGPWIEKSEGGITVRSMPDGLVGVIDLSCRDIPNMAFIASSKDMSDDYTLLGSGDINKIETTLAMRNNWHKEMGYRPNGSTLADLLWDQLTEGADVEGKTAPRPLIPTSDGKVNLRIGKIGLVKSEKFSWGDLHTHKIKASIALNLLKTRQDARAGKLINPASKQADYDYHRRVAQAYLDKYKISWAELRPAGWPLSEDPLSRNTTITDDFDGGNSTSLGQDLSWHDTWGDMQNNTNMAYQPGTSNYGFAIAESNLSTDDMYSQVVFPDGMGADNILVGARCNFSVTQDWYMGKYYIYSGHSIEKVVNASLSSLVSDSVTTDTLPLTLKIVVDGSDITLYANGDEMLSTTDTDLTGQTQGGIGMFNYYGWGDDFEAGDYTGSSPSVTVHERRRVVLAQ